ncbi:phosphopantetheinyl transferase-like protein [Streptomyces sp. NPDC048664]|uniref:4'-phosphopantetheinyl transferase family protein n=1 Tax=Streptomyces sp. NPDC048664 TaxID=3154505 RepID=UPI0034325644
MDAWLVDLDHEDHDDHENHEDHDHGARHHTEHGLGDPRDGLTADERRRAAAFVRGEDARRFSRARRTVRRLLADRLGTAPRDVRIGYDDAGKPRLPDHPGTHVSWSRSGPLLLVGATESGPLGVDVEIVRPEGARLDVLSFVYPAVPATASPEVFFPAWTLLEAAVKATGRGLAEGAGEVRLAFPADGSVALRGIDGHGTGPWHGHTVPVPARADAPGASPWAMTAFVSPEARPPALLRGSAIGPGCAARTAGGRRHAAGPPGGRRR